ncbi:MAG: hypothetical protein COU27_01185 [Candidatus Levybacteria bacterium CG10_big_fil_rev_8_21_14_0_10_36_7]|nr:MAG: hypothetical protein COU27_01185 [Candidatus Levybacteria bacterium CG10_big_fil_rev_8_21_14_0_10_36_7]
MKATHLIIFALGGIIAGIITTHCLRSTEESSAKHEKHLQPTANKIIGTVIYIKDPRTNVCFAYREELGYKESLATVPCESIPPELLVVAEVDGHKSTNEHGILWND